MIFVLEKETKQVKFIKEEEKKENEIILKENTQEAAVEKHIPVVERMENQVKVQVGSILHPATEEHYITMIAQVVENQINRVDLKPNEEPVAMFPYIENAKYYAYCNLHGLWKNEE